MKQGLKLHRIAALLAALALGACATMEPAPVEDRSSGDARPADVGDARTTAAPVEETYRVARGDTLYAIAFKRGIDFRDLAAWNHIAAPYRIFVDQELHLRAPPGLASAPVVATSPAPSAPTSTPQNPPVEKSTKPPSPMFEDVPPAATVAAAPAPEPPPQTPPTQPERPAKPVVAETPPPPKPVEAAPAPKPPAETAPPKPVVVAPAKTDEHVAELNAGGVHWRWPGEGKVVGTFVAGDQTKQGIDIAGKAGDPVQAAADGEVVYSGNGLLGYGELIIVKHNASFLSAYGHNRARLVKEGDKVKAGQQIAELGSGGARDELHFEIRKNGKPVNPLDYLPVR